MRAFLFAIAVSLAVVGAAGGRKAAKSNLETMWEIGKQELRRLTIAGTTRHKAL